MVLSNFGRSVEAKSSNRETVTHLIESKQLCSDVVFRLN